VVDFPAQESIVATGVSINPIQSNPIQSNPIQSTSQLVKPTPTPNPISMVKQCASYSYIRQLAFGMYQRPALQVQQWLLWVWLWTWVELVGLAVVGAASRRLLAAVHT
jgi:hypothetical protein